MKNLFCDQQSDIFLYVYHVQTGKQLLQPSQNGINLPRNLDSRRIFITPRNTICVLHLQLLMCMYVYVYIYICIIIPMRCHLSVCM